jgi:hypothetical protein
VKLLFSETTPDYARYLYPYVVWAFLEPGETPADAFAAGFLPGTPQLDRFYLVRQVRVPLGEWRPSSENRRILRKGAGIACELVPKAFFADTPERRARWLAYAAERFGEGVMPSERLDGLLGGPVISHLLHFTEPATGRELGTALLYLEPPRVAYYYFAFYDLGGRDRNLGLYMMTRALEFFAERGFTHAHLGTCVTPQALYKAQFEPLEFFNGAGWSRQVAELKHLVRVPVTAKHRLEEPEFLAFQPAPAAELAKASMFSAGSPRRS